jgi:2-polyprenyl-3-methyl-5-hydroxy-6-metoxy-1,4-benzoquinol methylase
LIETLNHETEDIWGYAKRLRFVRAVIGDAFGESMIVSVLDIGCGNGSQLAIPLASDERLQITAIDTDAASIEHGGELAESVQNLNFICTSIEDLPRDERFQVIILSEVLEHLEQPADMLRHARSLLDREGVLIVTVPNGYGEFELDSSIFRALRLQKVVDRLAQKSDALAATDNSASSHVQFFTRARLKDLFKRAGLVITAEGAGSFLAGPIAGHIIAKSRRLVEWNARVTDRLPLVLASGWYFALRLNKSDFAEGSR